MMSQTKTTTNNITMPDIAEESRPSHPYPIQEVGMDGIECMIQFKHPNGQLISSPATIKVTVNLIAPDQRGIHMSRLHQLCTQAFQNPFEVSDLDAILTQLISTHGSMSDTVNLDISFTYVADQLSLLSQHHGFRHYPVTISAKKSAESTTFSASFDIVYSSTCPCSAALSRQLIQNNFQAQFGDQDKVSTKELLSWLGNEKNMAATPHSQRSIATVNLTFKQSYSLSDLATIIQSCESQIKTPVQTAVKRSDEQEFARLNGLHLKFCEDAAREFYFVLDKHANIQSFKVAIRHEESLHPHNAIAIIEKSASE